MKKIIAVINGPNLNMIGSRKLSLYGLKTLDQINDNLEKYAKVKGYKVIFFQSNSEGLIIDFVQKERDNIYGVIINAGPLSFYGYALRDALVDTEKPIVTVHLSNIHARAEDFRHKDIMADISVGGIFGFQDNSYMLGLKALIDFMEIKKK